MNTKQKLKLKKFINELALIRGRHTELVSVYIPAGYDIIKVIQHLQQEQGTAANIKDAKTRKNVIDSLEKLIRHLKLYKQTPPNGLAAFSGNVAAQAGKVDLKVWSIEPPEPIKTRIYRCDQTFLVDILRGMLEEKGEYGLIVMDRREATIGVLKGTSIKTLTRLTSGVPGKIKAGGQCNVFGTLIQTATGDIIKIENSHNPIIIKSMIHDYLIKDSSITDKWVNKKQEVYKIKTKHPQLVIECSKDHLFLVSTENGIIEKPAEELKVEDVLLTPEKINIGGKLQKLNSKKYYNSFIINKKGRKLIKQKRESKYIYQRQLAKKIGHAHQTSISYYELGRQNIKSSTLQKLSKELNIDFEKFLRKYCKPHKYRNISLPTELDENFAQFLGYYMGDGCSEIDRITFFEQDKQVALDYQNKYNKSFEILSSYRFRKSKNYHQLKFISRPLVKLIKGEFSELKKTLDSEIPKKILESPPNIVAKFLRGFFDAEGWIHKTNNIGIASSNKIVIGQTQLLLLRFGIISSFTEYDNRNNPYSDKPIFKLRVNEKESILNYKKYIGFTSKRKQKALNLLIKSKSYKSQVRQILFSGKKVRKIIEKAGYNLQLFPKVSGFFLNRRMISKYIFKNSILANIKDKKLYKKLEKIYKNQILPVKISSIIITKKSTPMVDISVKNHNFVANGLIVHNSAQRYARITEGLAKEFYKRISEAANKEFLGKKDLKGILLGGPGPTKEEFKELLNEEIKKKLIAIQDLTYTDEFGLRALVEKSQDVLAKEAITEEKEILKKFFTLLGKEPGKVTYGEDQVKEALKIGAVETLLISEDVEDKKIEELEELADKTKSEIRIISTDTTEGAQLKDMTGIAAILRYAIQ